ncbi:hypothetical protein [Sphingobacterium thermophilum]
MKKFGKNPRPGKFSKTHKLWGKIGMWDMAGAAFTYGSFSAAFPW